MFILLTHGVEIKKGIKGSDGSIYFEVVTELAGVAKSAE